MTTLRIELMNINNITFFITFSFILKLQEIIVHVLLLHSCFSLYLFLILQNEDEEFQDKF